ncbi:hypothetical protein CR513_47735, partial [Mucuna pruriens]
MENKGEQYNKQENKGKREKIFKEGTLAPNLTPNSLQEGEDDMHMEGKGHIQHRGFKRMNSTILKDPITRGRLRKFQEEVHYEMCLFKSQGGPNSSSTLWAQ